MKLERKNKPDNRVEVSWFAPICNGDDEYLGSHDDKYKSNWKNASKIVKTADKLGFNNILLPTATIVSADNTISELFFFTALFFSSAILKT